MDVNKYILTKVDREFTNHADLKEVVNQLKEELNIPIKLCYAGEYDSCGYDCWYYALVYIVDGKIESIDVQVESY